MDCMHGLKCQAMSPETDGFTVLTRHQHWYSTGTETTRPLRPRVGTTTARPSRPCVGTTTTRTRPLRPHNGLARSPQGCGGCHDLAVALRGDQRVSQPSVGAQGSRGPPSSMKGDATLHRLSLLLLQFNHDFFLRLIF